MSTTRTEDATATPEINNDDEIPSVRPTLGQRGARTFFASQAVPMTKHEVATGLASAAISFTRANRDSQLATSILDILKNDVAPLLRRPR